VTTELVGGGLNEGMGIEVDDPIPLDGHEEQAILLRWRKIARYVDDTPITVVRW
jgi:hypothetical protein